jgi:hypothetical protein
MQLFKRIGDDIGRKNLIVQTRQDAIREAEEAFSIPNKAKRPVLVITDFHPMVLPKCRRLMDQNPNIDRDLREKRFQETARHHPELYDAIMAVGENPETQKKREGKAILIELGAVDDENSIRTFLARIARLVREEKTKDIKMEKLKLKIDALKEKIGPLGVVVSIIGLFL